MRNGTDFFEALLACEIRLWDVADRAVRAQHGVPLGRLRALFLIGEFGGCRRVQDLADRLLITVGAASKLVDRLERDGTARREPNAADGRSSRIVLTPSGTALVAAASATYDRVLDEALDGAITDAEVALLTQVLTRCRHILTPMEVSP